MTINMNSKTEDIFNFFTANHEALVSEYPGKFIVLRGESVIFARDSFDDALEAALASGLVPGEFLVQECTEGDSAYSHFFSSLDVFA